MERVVHVRSAKDHGKIHVYFLWRRNLSRYRLIYKRYVEQCLYNQDFEDRRQSNCFREHRCRV
jgi:hypothetical protein